MVVLTGSLAGFALGLALVFAGVLLSLTGVGGRLGLPLLHLGEALIGRDVS